MKYYTITDELTGNRVTGDQYEVVDIARQWFPEPTEDVWVALNQLEGALAHKAELYLGDIEATLQVSVQLDQEVRG